MIQFATMISVVLLSVTVHEFCHGMAAYRLGDDTASVAGRLTLNPIAHLDLFGSIILPLLLYASTGGKFTFAWAKPVPVDPRQFRRDISMRSGMSLVAAAGPASNIFLAFLFAGIFRSSLALQENAYANTAAVIAVHAVAINLFLAIFNLIPIPPLDGSKVLLHFMNHETARVFLRMEPYGFFIILFLFYATPVGNVVSAVAASAVTILLGIS